MTSATPAARSRRPSTRSRSRSAPCPRSAVDDPAAVAEGNSGQANSIIFAVTLSAPSTLQVQVPYTIANETATGGAACAPGVDYVPPAGPLVFAPNDTSETIVVPICGDTVAEGNETLLVNLGTPTNATLLDGQGIGTIADDEGAAGLSISDATVAEGDAGTATLTFTVTLAPPSAQQVTVPFSTANQTAASGAACAAGVDYVTTSRHAHVRAGRHQRDAHGDRLPGHRGGGERDAAGEPRHADRRRRPRRRPGPRDDHGRRPGRRSLVQLRDGQRAGERRQRDDHRSAERRHRPERDRATMRACPAAASARTRPPPRRRRAAGPSRRTPSAPASVSFATADQTATAGQDYVATAGTLNFGVNETTKTITIPILAGQPPGRLGVVPRHALEPDRRRDASGRRRRSRSSSSTPRTARPGTPATTAPTTSGRSASARPRRSDGSASAPTGATGTTTPSKATCIETRCDEPWPYVVIANRDGEVEVRLIKEAQAACSSIQVGDYLEADGEKQHEQLFDADSFEVKRRR